MTWLALTLGFVAGLAFGAGLILLLVQRSIRSARSAAGRELYAEIERAMRREERP